MFELILTATPTSDLPSDWALYIILTLLGFIGSIFMFIKWLAGLVASKTDKIVDDFKSMHREGMQEIKQINDRSLQNQSTLSEVKTDIKETKYAIQTLNTKIKCKDSA